VSSNVTNLIVAAGFGLLVYGWADVDTVGRQSLMLIHNEIAMGLGAALFAYGVASKLDKRDYQ